jgi:hypothetical protein
MERMMDADEDEKPSAMTPEEIQAWWDRWGLDHTTSRAERKAAYVAQKESAAWALKGRP